MPRSYARKVMPRKSVMRMVPSTARTMRALRASGGLNAGTQAHRHGQDIVDEERGRADEPGHDAEVVLRDDVGAPATRIREDRLAVRRNNDGDERGDADSDRQGVAERCRPGEDQHEENLLGRVRDGGERVRGEDGKRGGLAEALVA